MLSRRKNVFHFHRFMRCNSSSTQANKFDQLSEKFDKFNLQHSVKSDPNYIEPKPFDEIVQSSSDRLNKKYFDPSRAWLHNLKNLDIKYVDKGPSNYLKMLEKSQKIFNKKIRLNISPNLLEEVPINIGDAVELSTSLNNSVLAMIADLPTEVNDPRYTLINHKGEVIFASKSLFKFRIPNVLPPNFLKNSVIREVSSDDSPPVGTPKSIFGSTIVTSVASSAANNLNPINEPTFIVPAAARQSIMLPLVEITKDAWTRIPIISRKLEMLHRILQNFYGPKTISILNLYKSIQIIDLNELDETSKKGMDAEEFLNKYCSKLSERIGEKINFLDFSFGKEFGSSNNDHSINISEYYALILSIRKQPRLWGKIIYQSNNKIPVAVTILPIHRSHLLDVTINQLKSPLNNYRTEFVSFVEKTIKNSMNEPLMGKPKLFDEITELLKQFVAGNVNDSPAITMITKILKEISIYSDVKLITKSTCYDLLMKLKIIKGNENPIIWSNDLQLPFTNTSTKSDFEQDYFNSLAIDSVDKDFKLSETQIESGLTLEDPSKSIRHDFRELPVYCIDSEIAHEIDDGLSLIKHSDNCWEILVHIADPTSFIQPNSDISKIAFERSFTTYLPEKVYPMLPSAINELSGLGINGKKTRSMTFSFTFDPNEDNIADNSKFKVIPGYIQNFPKFTYKSVDELLENQSSEHSIHLENFKDFLKIAEKLRIKRIKNGAILFDDNNSKELSLVVDSLEDLPPIDVYNGTETLDSLQSFKFNEKKISSKSQLIVSEMMIMANFISGDFFKRNAIPSIFRGLYELPRSSPIKSDFKKIREESVRGKYLDLSQIIRLQHFFNSSFYSSSPRKHEMLGISVYSPSTSPLRRYGDMISHWQIHSILNKKSLSFDNQQCNTISNHIQIKNIINRDANRKSNNFWILNYLSRKMKMNKENEEHESFKCIVSHPPHMGLANVTLIGYGINCDLDLKKNGKPPKVGDIIDNLSISYLDILEQKIVLTYNE